MITGISEKRVDAFDKVTGRAKYTDDLCERNALVAKVLHATIANGTVKKIDTSEAEKVEGVVKIVTCFDVPDRKFATPGHPWSEDPHNRDVEDRVLLTKRIRYYGDDIAAVVAENEIAAKQALALIKVEYDVYPFVLDPLEAIKDGAPQLFENFPHNILAETHMSSKGKTFEEVIQEPGLIKVEGWYETPTVQHCMLENCNCFAYMEGGRITVVTSTQIPHIVRRVVGQALGLPWGQIRIIKPYIGGGFGNKQDAQYEPLCAYLTMILGGRLVKLENTREEAFVNNRVRHAEKNHFITYVRPDGTFAARKMELYSNQGAYASHGHAIAAKGCSCFMQIYHADYSQADGYTVFTNRPVAGAMRAYGIPQVMFTIEAHIDDIAHTLHMDPVELRRKNMMEVGFKDGFTKNVNYYDTLNEIIDKGKACIDYDHKMKAYQNQTGPVRRGIGMALAWYTTAVWPLKLESSSCRMVMNQDGSIQLSLGETEIGQGADTAFAQMAAEALGIPFEMVHTVTVQDTDLTPFGTGAYASRQTYIAGFSIKQTAELLKQRILDEAHIFLRYPAYDLDLVNGNIIHKTNGEILMSIGDLARTALYSQEFSQHLTAESTYNVKSSAYSFSCCFAEVEVDIPMCKVKLLNIVNVHDCGKLINPALAEAQVHGGMSMGIGYGLSEQELFDPKTGRVLNPNLLDYKLSTAMDHPELEAEFIQNPEPTSPFGTKALGEPPAISPAPAIRNAIYNATGVKIDQIPITPHILFKRFTEEGLIQGGE